MEIITNKVFWIYMLAINLVTCATFAWDKRLARRRARRIPESTLIWLAFAGGSLGGLMGMYIFHHKTKHIKFKWGLPLIIIFQFGVLYFLYF